MSVLSRRVVSQVVRRALGWPGRVNAARRAMNELAHMSDYELRDIGLTRQDVADVSALPLDQDPTVLLARRREAARDHHEDSPLDLAA